MKPAGRLGIVVTRGEVGEDARPEREEAAEAAEGVGVLDGLDAAVDALAHGVDHAG